jgi:hypothetical protein
MDEYGRTYRTSPPPHPGALLAMSKDNQVGLETNCEPANFLRWIPEPDFSFCFEASCFQLSEANLQNLVRRPLLVLDRHGGRFSSNQIQIWIDNSQQAHFRVAQAGQIHTLSEGFLSVH